MARDWKAARAAAKLGKHTAIGGGLGLAAGLTYVEVKDDPSGGHRAAAIAAGVGLGVLGGAGYSAQRALKVGSMTRAAKAEGEKVVSSKAADAENTVASNGRRSRYQHKKNRLKKARAILASDSD